MTAQRNPPGNDARPALASPTADDSTERHQSRLAEIAAELSLPLTDRDATRLVDYLNLLLRWNATYNLTAIREPDRILTQHLADCLAVMAPIRRVLGERRNVRVLDVGSGGGLPGAVIAMLEPALDVTCIDAVGKKAAFVQQVSASLRLPNLHSIHARVEALKATPFELITSRAFASLADFVSLTQRHLAPSGIWMAMKGKRPDVELQALPPGIEVFHVEQLQVPALDAERCLVWMRPSASL